MLQILYPLALLGITGVLVPVIIHLWNVKQGKTLKIGSIVFLGESSKLSAKSFKITDWFLLFLRCLIIVLLAFILSQPFINEIFNSNKNIGWILIEKSQLNNINNNHRKEIDSLIQKGYQLRALKTGFSKINMDDTVLKDIKPEKQLSYISFIKQLNAQSPPAFTVYFYAQNLKNKFKGTLPQISFNLKMRLLRAPNSSTSEIMEAYFTSKDSIRLTILKADSAGIFYQKKNLKNDIGLLIKTENGLTYVKNNKQANWIKVGEEIINITVYEKSDQDRIYLNAAINAIEQYTQKKIAVNFISKIEAISNSPGILFWLSEEPLPNLKWQIGTKIFTYQKGKVEIKSSILQTAISQQSNSMPSSIYKSWSGINDVNEMIWKDGFGKPMLTLQSKNGVSYYRFYTKLNPQWTNMVWKQQFVKNLIPLVLKPTNASKNFGFETDTNDFRFVSKNLQFKQIKDKQVAGFVNSEKKPIMNIIWLVCFLLFGLERFLSLKVNSF